MADCCLPGRRKGSGKDFPPGKPPIETVRYASEASIEEDIAAVTLAVNSEQHQVLRRDLRDGGVPTDVTPTTTLADYLRQYQQLPGTKTMCREGMCGACVVNVTSVNPATGQMESRAVNSCMVPLKACHDWKIETVEGIGNRKDGYHPVQARLAQMNGTQCGYCSPGMVMSMYSLLKNGGQVTEEQVEQAMDGNLCRCTGYRPILDAFKTFKVDADEKTKKIVRDIEEASGCHGNKRGPCQSTGSACAGCPRASMTAADDDWRLPTSLQQAITDLEAMSVGGKTIRLVAGNTSTGVLDKYEAPSDGYISLLKIPELRVIKRPGEKASKWTPRWQLPGETKGAVFGAAVTLSQFIKELDHLSGTPGYRHCAQMAKHLRVVANTPVRNAATWAGNLMIKYKHRDFPSDVFLLLTAAKAKLKIVEGKNAEEMSVEMMYNISMKNKFIVSMTLPPIDENKYIFKTYKITPRAISAHAYVNAAFVIPFDTATAKITEKPTILFGGINDRFVHATNTERYLTGRSLMAEATVKGALTTLLDEVEPHPDPEHADVAYRKRLTGNLLYKAILYTLGDRVPVRLRSGGDDLTRSTMKGTQEFDTDKTLWPVNKAVPKLEAQIQTSGEAEYVDDQPALPGELYGHYVLSTMANAKIGSVDASKALAMKGVRGFYTAKDIVGKNQFISLSILIPIFSINPQLITPQQVFAEDMVRFAGQPIGLVVADTKAIARRAAALVNVEYTQVAAPVLTIRDALKTQPDGRRQSAYCPLNVVTGDTDAAMASAPRRVKGEWEMGGQYHFTMEPHTVRVIPCEDGQLNIYSATQGIKHVVDVVSDVVNIPAHKINAEVRRIGGGYGGKISNPIPIASACAVAATKLNKPVRMVLDIENMIEMCSGRFPFMITYEAGFDDTGKLLALKLHMITDNGFSMSTLGFLELQEALSAVSAIYRTDNWNVTPGTVKTNLPINTSCRAPGTINGFAAIETVMRHIAHELNMDPWDVKKVNFALGSGATPPPPLTPNDEKVFSMMIKEMFEKGDIDARKADIRTFNKANRWRKRSLALVPISYHINLAFRYPALVSIYDKDGSVAVSHGGVEMGQGINTKVAQVVAHVLGVPLEQVSVKPNNNLVNPNGVVTGGSLGSDMNCMAARLACEVLRERLMPFMAEGRPWLQVVQYASGSGVNLSAHSLQPPTTNRYSVWGLCAAEAELDVLTGEYRFNRVDLYEDAGKALSPLVDVGQVEGAFTMGMGVLLFEQLRTDPKTGRKVTNRAWNYYPPTHKDMPRDFRVKLLKNNVNDVGIFNSKATGEPASCMANACLMALHQAVAEARKAAGLKDWITINSPSTAEYTQMACETTPEMLVIT
ncbi:abscisic-aldehyde oxidase-like [Amphibalanus amphitrite]|uniref:abscisic-aldehyde oxidase-like n=1 Tax=Amphibalanus amphitrite TaxID=1232801 RepID=UPI001C90F604|nr:abscisic-aldehyde oxidase-like [Amphibalanus amphitrite]